MNRIAPKIEKPFKALLALPDTDERIALQKVLEDSGVNLTACPDHKTAWEILSRGDHLVAILFHDPGRADGIKVLKQIKECSIACKVILLVHRPVIEDAQEAMSLGAEDYMIRPWNHDAILFAIMKAMSEGVPISPDGNETARRHSAKKNRSKARRKIITRSPAFRKVLEQAKKVAPSKAAIFITGESGTGKELLARFIHDSSDRSSGPFVALNCAALPETLLESELFGYEKGAFSGAVASKPGKFELADKGTLLLDEITEMDLSLQAKLLRVIQEGEVDRLGSTRPIPVDARIIATTNRDPRKAVEEGLFREDLFFRLNVIPLKIPSLKERPEDIEKLANEFLHHFSTLYGKNGMSFAVGVTERLTKMPWKGNVRELKNLIERGVLLAEGNEIRLEHLLLEKGESEQPSPQQADISAIGTELFNLSEIEREMVKKALEKTYGNRTHAAKLLGISVRTLRNKLAEYRKLGMVL